MESNQPPFDNPKPPSSTTEPQQTATHTPRSYECNFCKRGFTNAQALGGHMNIHRKDKPKFKYSTTTTPPIATMEPPSPNRGTAADPFAISHQGNLLLLDRHDGVDLELRLGHVEVEPPLESSSDNITTTRKFF